MYEEAVVNVSKFIVKLYGCLSKTGQASYDRCLNSVPQSTRGPVPAARATVPTTRCLSCQKFTNLGLLLSQGRTIFYQTYLVEIFGGYMMLTNIVSIHFSQICEQNYTCV
jgi:hypothetical protein